MTFAGEISKYKLDLVGGQEVRWDRGGTESAGEYTFFYGEGNENHELGTGYVGFEVLTAVVMKSIIFWDMTLFSYSFGNSVLI
jgi:hypothetical protein